MALAATAHRIPLEVAHTLIEMAEVARYAFEHRPGHHPQDASAAAEAQPAGAAEEEAARLRAENALLRTRLADDLALLHDLHGAPQISKECPPDLYTRLLAAVNNSSFLGHLEKVRGESIVSQHTRSSSSDMKEMEVGDVPNTIGDGKNGSWVLVSHDTVAGNLEEISGIDSDNYVVIHEEDIVDGIATFVARCILENPKSKLLSPVELQRAVARALGTMKDQRKWRSVWEAGKVIYTLATWGITLVGLYRSRAILKAAAKGVGASAKFVLKAL